MNMDPAMVTVPARLVDIYDKVHGTANKVTKCVCVWGGGQERGEGKKGKERKGKEKTESDFAH